MKNRILIIVLLALAGFAMQRQNTAPSDVAVPQADVPVQPVSRSVTTSADEILAQAFRNRSNGLQVEGSGVVTRVLADDNEGSRHQRFILSLTNGQTLLVAHNIDLAPRIGTIKPGDRVDFYGEYEWNNQGGVIHWTHHDPQGHHVAGWLKHNGRTYQ